MLKSYDEKPYWHRSLSLEQRIRVFMNSTPPQDFLPENPVTPSALCCSASAVISCEKETDISDFAKRRLQNWRSQSPFNVDNYWGMRLNTSGLTEENFLYLLSEDDEIFDQCSKPEWVLNLEKNLSQLCLSFDPYKASESDWMNTSTDGFLFAVKPIFMWAYQELSNRINGFNRASQSHPYNPTTIVDVLFEALPQRLFEMLHRTMTLELHVKRLRGELEGNSPEQRFSNFLKHLEQPQTIQDLLNEYPVLYQQLMLCAKQWLDSNLDFLNRLNSDWASIRNCFEEKEPLGLLIGIKEAGDRHQGGRSVYIVQFDSGFQIVYKPRPMSADRHFQEFYTWLNRKGCCPTFRPIKILDRSDYGWMEFVPRQSCSSEDEVKRFYERQGGNLAILYLLKATDFHAENLIASGEHPILIDLESLFQPNIDTSTEIDLESSAYQILNDSVLRASLLPERLWNDSNYSGVDISGFYAKAGQLSPEHQIYWEQAGTDQMYLTKQQTQTKEHDHFPILNSSSVDILQYIDAIIKGFTQVYDLFVENREELLAHNGPLNCFANDPIRVIVRHTRFYELLRQESFHPNVLRNALDRDQLFDRLWFDIKYQPQLARLIHAEHSELWNGDIPKFTSTPSSCDLWTGLGERIPNYLYESGMALVRRHLMQLGQEDLQRQLWYIRASLYSILQLSHGAPTKTYSLTLREQPLEMGKLLDTAEQIADRLEQIAIQRNDQITWIGLNSFNSIAPLWIDLYDGLPGIALFYAYLGELTHSEHYTRLAHFALNATLHQLKRIPPDMISVGGFSGWGGILYTFTHLGRLWNDNSLVKEIEVIIERLPKYLENPHDLDIISGLAGCIIALLGLGQTYPHLSGKTLEIATTCGMHLLNSAVKTHHGVSWMTQTAKTTPICGFSHGSTGILWSLLKLAADTGNQQFYAMAQSAIEHENDLFVHSQGNWPDLRDAEMVIGKSLKASEKLFSVAWCHGASGMGLAYLDALKYIHDINLKQQLTQKIQIALTTTLSQGFGKNHSLCHGDLGNLEFIFCSGQVLKDEKLITTTYKLANSIIDCISNQGYICGVTSGIETPGLMTGLAGIGFELLRLYKPQLVPSVLTLAPSLT